MAKRENTKRAPARKKKAAASADEPVVVVVTQEREEQPAEPPAEEPPAAGPAEEAAAPADEPVALADVPGLSIRLADEGPAGSVDSGEPPVSPELKAIVESLIFASPEPLPAKALVKLLDSEPKEDVLGALDALRRDYAHPRGLQLVEIAGGYQIVTRTDLHEWVRRLFHERKSTKLSVQALESLAVIAYRQPVTAAEITEIRGVNASGVLATLIERKLVKIAGRKAVVGRPFLYATTREFLMRFGLNDLSDLPKVEDMADLLGFDLQGMLGEPTPSDQRLPLELPADEAVPTTAEPAAAEPGPDSEDAAAEAASEVIAREELEHSAHHLDPERLPDEPRDEAPQDDDLGEFPDDETPGDETVN
jgi:segregation and condensation protein B